MITKYGLVNFFVFICISLFLISSIFFVNLSPLFLIPAFLGLLLFIFAFIFFRDPKRKIDSSIINDNTIILSPADGRIVEIVQELEPIFLKQQAIRVSIFLSPFDVHVNRIPINGKVVYLEYVKGKFLAAYKPRASMLNEQTHIGIENENGLIFFKQIVGVAARRLVCELKLGDEVKIGATFGMMKFGSRIDIFLPLDSIIFVNIKNRVVAGKTIIAKLINNM